MPKTAFKGKILVGFCVWERICAGESVDEIIWQTFYKKGNCKLYIEKGENILQMFVLLFQTNGIGKWFNQFQCSFVLRVQQFFYSIGEVFFHLNIINQNQNYGAFILKNQCRL